MSTHVYFAKNVVAYFPFNSWLSFQRQCRILWGLSLTISKDGASQPGAQLSQRKSVMLLCYQWLCIGTVLFIAYILYNLNSNTQT